MKISKLIEKYGYITLANDYGSCACGDFYVANIHIVSKCHRSGRCKKHDYACVHVWPDRESDVLKIELKKILELVAKEVGDSYSCQVERSLQEI